MKSSNCWLAHCIYASEEENTFGGDDKQEMEILSISHTVSIVLSFPLVTKLTF